MHSAFNLFVFFIASHWRGHGISRFAFQLPNKKKVNGDFGTSKRSNCGVEVDRQRFVFTSVAVT